MQQAEEERVRMALDRGCDRDTVAAVMGVTDWTTWHKEARAKAYDFPLAALESHRGQSDKGEETRPDPAAPQGDAVTGDVTTGEDGQQQLVDVAVDDWLAVIFEDGHYQRSVHEEKLLTSVF